MPRGGNLLQERLEERLHGLLTQFEGQNGAVIPLLQKVQETFGYLPRETIAQVAKFFKVSESEIFGVATFYAQFRFTRPGDHAIKVCLGTACHVRGGTQIMGTIERELEVKSGGTTKDYKFGLDRVACFGSCALAPVLVIDDKVYGRLTTSKVKEIIAKYQ
ncbi:MAG: NADH dehydrogenase [Chloroflexi bacterium RBG_13_53_26]|nr:MAG: NADH dehydrogenase [Chloroflexi bacterium RBG_13_53_26]